MQYNCKSAPSYWWWVGVDGGEESQGGSITLVVLLLFMMLSSTKHLFPKTSSHQGFLFSLHPFRKLMHTDFPSISAGSLPSPLRVVADHRQQTPLLACLFQNTQAQRPYFSPSLKMLPTCYPSFFFVQVPLWNWRDSLMMSLTLVEGTGEMNTFTATDFP